VLRGSCIRECPGGLGHLASRSANRPRGDRFEGFDLRAAWQDAKVGLEHLTDWERIAVVTDVGWMRTAVRTFAFAMPSLVRVFANAELASARAWVGQGR